MGQEVKIIGLKLNQQLGIVQSCELEFDPENRLIVIKGPVGSGKTTLQRALRVGTTGANTLKDDKSLYGQINEEVQLLDGNTNIFVGCKTNKGGGLDYVIYTKDIHDNIIKNPVIDGEKITPAKYLESLQTALTWRMEELYSENSNVQKKLLLSMYKSELAELGIVYDKSDENYSKTILGRIDEAVNDRTLKDFKRKEVGGFAVHLEPLGIDPVAEETWPKKKDLSKLTSEKGKIELSIQNVEATKTRELGELVNKGDSITNKLEAYNNQAKTFNEEIQKDFDHAQKVYIQNNVVLDNICKDLRALFEGGCFTEKGFESLERDIRRSYKNESPISKKMKPLLSFTEKGKCSTNVKDWDGEDSVKNLLTELSEVGEKYRTMKAAPLEDTGEYEKDLKKVNDEISSCEENNRRFEMLSSFHQWQDANNKVLELREEYASMLKGIDTGVPGLKIFVDVDEKQDIYMTYDGSFDVDYFNNPKKEQRKLSSYSGTQKPLICLLLQNYLLSKKKKSLRYLWIDNVPIDNKTRELLTFLGS